VSVSFIGGLVNEQEYPEKTTNLPHVSEQLYHIMLHRVYLGMSEIPTHNLNGDNHYWLHRGVVNPTTIRSRPQRPPFYVWVSFPY